jgi:hypothetical protein
MRARPPRRLFEIGPRRVSDPRLPLHDDTPRAPLMLGSVATALLSIPDALALGIAAMGFDSAAFRAVAEPGGQRDLVVIVVYLAGVSQAVGNGVVLFLNRVRRLRFALTLALMGAIYLVGALVTAAATLLLADLAFGRNLAFLPTIAVVGLAQAPRLLGFLTLAPYFGELFDRLLDVWVLTLVLFGLHQGIGLPAHTAALLALLGWAAMRLFALVLGRPLAILVAALKHAAAGGPLTLDSRNLVEALKEQARAGAPRRNRDR